MLTIRPIIIIISIVLMTQKQDFENLTFLNDNTNQIECIAIKTLENLNFTKKYDPVIIIDNYKLSRLEIGFNGEYKKNEDISTEEKYVINNLKFNFRISIKRTSYTSVYEIFGDADKIEILKNSSNFNRIQLDGYGLSELSDEFLNSLEKIFIEHFENIRKSAINLCKVISS